MKKPSLQNPFIFTPSVVLLPLLFVLVLWFVYWLEVTQNISFSHYGIYPRKSFGFKGVFFSSLGLFACS